jgi:excisionase family DNA binding protein
MSCLARTGRPQHIVSTPDGELLTVAEFCRLFRISRTSAYGFLRSGELRAVKIGRGTRIRRADAAAWEARLPAYRPLVSA